MDWSESRARGIIDELYFSGCRAFGDSAGLGVVFLPKFKVKSSDLCAHMYTHTHTYTLVNTPTATYENKSSH